jgi:hypothetical protein
MPKEKVTLYLEPEMKAWLESQVDEEQKVSAVVRNLIRKAMKLKSRKKEITTVNDPFSFYTITADLIPDDLKEYSELLIEWWPIRKQKGGSCTTSVAERIFKTLRSFPSQDRKEALEKAITGGWKDIYPLKKGYKPEEPKNHPNQKVFKASDVDLPPTLAELNENNANKFMGDF